MEPRSTVGSAASVERQLGELLALIGCRLGLAGDGGPLLPDQAFLSPSGLPCRLLAAPAWPNSPDLPAAALWVVFDLPLSTVELEPQHLSQLFQLQAVLASCAGWSLDVAHDDGQLCVRSVRPVTSAEQAVAELEAGSWLSLSVLQRVTA